MNPGGKPSFPDRRPLLETQLIRKTRAAIRHVPGKFPPHPPPENQSAHPTGSRKNPESGADSRTKNSRVLVLQPRFEIVWKMAVIIR